MVCKKCGCETLISDGDWLKCPNCGANFFNISISDELSATRKIDMIDSEADSPAEDAGSKSGKKTKAEKKAEKKAQKSKENKKAAEKINAGDIDLKAAPPAAAQENNAEFLQDGQLAPESESNVYDEALPETADTSEVSVKKRKKEKKQSSKLKSFVEFMIPIVVAVILALLLKTFVFANAVVPSGSMRNTIEAGDRVIASRIAYVSEDPERYDIIIFDYPDDETQAFVKRIIGMPGETITIVNGVVYYSDSDGQLYRADSSFVTVETATGDFGPYYIPYKGEVISVSGGYCYAENGAQVGSLDFLTMYCEQDKETGEYVVAQNLYFCMGDNRNDSHDSRYWDNTYVSEDKIIGKVMFRYYPSIEKIE
ncbi:MAG: signal peptidase I [Clostridiales bacterium]|nr:signal peptidase I [Clostridiales bacterium]